MRDVPALSIEGFVKGFGGIRALNDVTFNVQRGTIHGLVGRNGSGKSTLVKALSGYHTLDQGRLLVHGRVERPGSDKLAFVHQDLGLIGAMSVMDNMILGRRPITRRGRIDWSEERRTTWHALERFNLRVNASEPVDALTKEELTVVAIARALERSGPESVLVLDEPTSLLPRHEGTFLFDAMKSLRDQGIAIVFVSHNLQEIVDLADTVTVLKDGEVVDTRATRSGSTDDGNLDVSTLITMMVGEDAHPRPKASHAREAGCPLLELIGIRGGPLEDLSLQVGGGEVVGVTGLMGGGLDDLAWVASGRSAPDRGEVKRATSPQGRSLKIGLVPGDRQKLGIFEGLSVRENITIASLNRYVAHHRLSKGRENEAVSKWLVALDIRPPDGNRPIETLSGGNQQKALLARWLSMEPDVLVLKDPTQGVDVAAKQEILEHVERAADSGMGVLICSYEFEEIAPACDRLVVLRSGRVAAELERDEIVTDRVLELMR